MFDRITAAVDKVELLWQQAFSKARLQLQVFQLREDALQVSHWTGHLGLGALSRLTCLVHCGNQMWHTGSSRLL